MGTTTCSLRSRSEAWETPPFSPEIRNDRIYARGSTDNKGQILAHILGVEEALKRDGELPVNVIFLVEGEEEVGSTNLAAFLEANREELKCDVIVISDTGMAAHGCPTLSYALRGIAALELIVRGPSVDLHSGVFGGAVANPATAVARILSTLHNEDGHVMVQGFYDSVRPMDDWERKAAAELPVTDELVRELTGVSELFGEKGFSTSERVGARPTAEVNGIGGGYQGEGTKTVLPREAFAKLTFRLVPNQTPEEIIKLVETHIRKHVPLASRSRSYPAMEANHTSSTRCPRTASPRSERWSRFLKEDRAHARGRLHSNSHDVP